MNERIEAYLKQQQRSDYFNSYGETVEDDHYFMYREDIDGLIELIVKECTNVLNRRFMGDLNREDLEVRRCIEDVQKYFGVER